MSTQFEPRTLDATLLRRVSRIVNSSLSLDEMLGQILGLTAQVSRCDACLVYLLDSETGGFLLRASQLPRSQQLGNLRIKPGEGVTGWVAEHQSLVALDSRASADSRFKNFSTLVEDTYEAFLSVPLVSRGKTIGVINVHHLDRHEHTQDEIALMSFIAEQMGSAIAKSLIEDENLRIAERDKKLEQYRIQLEQEVAARTAELKAANEELRNAKEKAEELARLKSEFLGKLEFQATHDSLTGVSNRSAVLETLAAELARSRREANTVGVLLADLDHFKQVNDIYGHLAGDKVLRETATKISSSVRFYDTVGRYGGEEFLIILPGCDLPEAMSRAEAVRAAVEKEPVKTLEGTIPVTLSLGVTAGGGLQKSEVEGLLRAADAALYRAKNAGRNRVVSSNDIGE